jgi:hypothetical protein
MVMTLILRVCLVLLFAPRVWRLLRRPVPLAKDEDHHVRLAEPRQASNLWRVLLCSEIFRHNRFMPKSRHCLARGGADLFHAGNEGADEHLHIWPLW